MRSEQTFGVDIIVRKCTGDKSYSLLYAKITVDHVPVELSLKERIKTGTFDWHAEKVIGNSAEVKQINENINDVRAKLKHHYRQLMARDEIVTSLAVKQAYLGVQADLKGHTLMELVDYYYKIWYEKITDGSMKNYRTTITYIKSFLKDSMPRGDIYLSQLSMQVLTDFEYYVKNNPIKIKKPCKGNGLAKNLQRFKRIIAWAKEIDWIKINPIENYKAGTKTVERMKLSLDEVFAIENFYFADENLSYVRDLFIFSCFTGQAFVDVMDLKPEHLERSHDGKVWLIKNRIKSAGLSAVPMLTRAVLILDKYWLKGEGPNGGCIFPKVTNQHVNRCLKIIQSVLGIQLKITFHLARHTFATTIALKFKVPITAVKVLLGHKKITTTEIYTKVDEEKMLDDTEGWEERIDMKREAFLLQGNPKKRALQAPNTFPYTGRL